MHLLCARRPGQRCWPWRRRHWHTLREGFDHRGMGPHRGPRCRLRRGRAGGRRVGSPVVGHGTWVVQVGLVHLFDMGALPRTGRSSTCIAASFRSTIPRYPGVGWLKNLPRHGSTGWRIDPPCCCQRRDREGPKTKGTDSSTVRENPQTAAAGALDFPLVSALNLIRRLTNSRGSTMKYRSSTTRPRTLRKVHVVAA